MRQVEVREASRGDFVGDRKSWGPLDLTLSVSQSGLDYTDTRSRSFVPLFTHTTREILSVPSLVSHLSSTPT